MNVIDAIKTRRSVREYSTRSIPPDACERMRQALRLAPSACNLQPWRFIFVTNPKRRRNVAEAASDQMFIAEAPVIVVGCGIADQAYKAMGGSGNSVDIDVAIALDHLTLAAVEEGLGTCWIGSFDEEQIKRLLEIPPQAKVVAMTPLGYPASDHLITPVADSERKNPNQIFATDSYG